MRISNPILEPFGIGLWSLPAASVLILLSACVADTPPPPNEVSPPTYRVDLDTSCGPIEIDVTRADAPIGADRFYNMVRSHYLDGARFFRVVPGFVVQFGLSGNPATTKAWNSPIKDDPLKGAKSNTRGTLVFAMPSEPNSRTSQLFINLTDNRDLDASGFVPIGKVVKGMDCVDRIFSGYGETPDQDLISAQGDDYLVKTFPKLDYIKTARLAAAAPEPRK